MVTYLDVFKSFYYSNTYVPPVDLSDRELERDLFAHGHPKEAEIVQRLISTDFLVKRILSEFISYNNVDKLRENHIALSQNGFKLLNVNTAVELRSFSSVVEHDDLQGWLIKAGSARTAEGMMPISRANDRGEIACFTAEDSLLRIAMAKRILKIAWEAGIGLIVPEKKLVVYPEAEDEPEPTRKYCVICQKLDVLSAGETIESIKRMHSTDQQHVAKQISTIVQKAGLVNASFHNIRFTKDGKLALIDTAPVGLMVAQKEGLWNRLFGPRGSSVEKCGRIGLFSLKAQTSSVACDLARKGSQRAVAGNECEPGLESFRRQIEEDYQTVITPKFSKWKMGMAALSLGLLPLIHAIMACVKLYLIIHNQQRMQELESVTRQNAIQRFQNPEAASKMDMELHTRRLRDFSYRDGVVASAPMEKIF